MDVIDQKVLLLDPESGEFLLLSVPGEDCEAPQDPLEVLCVLHEVLGPVY